MTGTVTPNKEEKAPSNPVWDFAQLVTICLTVIAVAYIIWG